MDTIILSTLSKNIEYVIHVSDIHIRTGDLEKSRYNEYGDVFKEFVLSVSKLENLDKSVLVITGDIFHHKGKIEPSGIKLSQSLLTSLLEYVDVCMICGNHDYRQDSPDIPDMIETIYENYINQTVNTKYRAFYLNRTGYYHYNNVCFSVVNIKDTLKKYNTVGKNENTMVFPPRTYDKTYNIALFHGTMFFNSYQLDWFDGYEYVMLGDNHTMKWSIDKEMLWGYAGSLIQQDFGERFMEHGYFVWKLKEKVIDFYNVFNDYGFCSVKEIDNKLFAFIKKNTWVDLCNIKPFPTNVSFRVFSKECIPKLETFCKTKNIKPSSITCWHSSTEYETVENNSTDLEELNTTDKWFEYLSKYTDIEKIKHFILHPELLKLPDTGDIIKKHRERNEKIQKVIDEYRCETTKIHKTVHRVELVDMKWSYLMCYGENNHFNFEAIRKEIALLNGKNAIGKSSFLDVICIALYGEPTKMRNLVNGKKYTDKIIHDQRPSNKTAPSVKLQFKTNGSVYEIYRSFGVQSIKVKEHAILQTKVQIYQFFEDDVKKLICEGSTLVDKWIENCIGNIEDILMSIMICQTDLNNFFHLKQDDQKNILDKALRLDTVSLYGKILRESVLAHNDINTQLKTAKQTLLSLFPKDTDMIEKEINTSEKELWRDEILKHITRIIKDTEIVANIDFVFNESEILYIEENIKKHLSCEDTELSIIYREKLENIQKDLKCMNDVELIDNDSVLYKKWQLKMEAFLLKEPKCEVNMEWVQRTLESYNKWCKKTTIDCSDYPDIENRLLNFVKIEKPLKNPTIHPMSCPITEQEYNDYKKKYTDMMENPIVKNRTPEEYDEWFSGYTLWSNNKVTDIDKVYKRSKLYIGKIEEYNARVLIEKELDELKDVEYNHDCWACKKNPFSIKKTALLDKYKQLSSSKTNKSLVSKWQIIVEECKEKIEKHEEYLKQKTMYDKEMIYWKDILATWKKYDDWKLESDRILGDIEYYENYTYSQLWKKYKVQDDVHSKLLKEYQAKKDRYTEKQEWDGVLEKINKYKSIYELYEVWNGEHKILLEKLKNYELSIKKRTLQFEAELCEKEYVNYKRRADIISNYEKYKNMFYSYKLHRVDKELKVLLDEKSKQDANNEIIKKHKISFEKIVALEDLYNDRISKIKELELLFIGDKVSSDGYKEWIYKNQVIPLINTEMNVFLNMFENFTFHMTYDKKHLIYLIEDRGNFPTLDKASGYQNFIIGLAFRIILTRIGAIGQQLKHLFIDEGFTACDSVNIEKVPALLRSILKYGKYESILIMSHLDSVRDCTSIHINIERKDPFSYIHF